ncbi:MAG: prepilin peptidase [Candidatus Jordarchaeales archaeon]|nr:prepilin peptidase [Candidatus Jordarchaeia archaeon]
MNVSSFQLVPLAIALLTLSCASYFDVKTRRVPNKVWIPPVLVGVATTPIMVEQGVFQVEEVTVSLASALLLAYLLHGMRVLGGADCKAIIVACLLTPVGRSRLPLHFFPIALITNLFIMLGALTLAAAATYWIRKKAKIGFFRNRGELRKEGVDGFSWRKFSPPLMPLITLSVLISFFLGNLAFATIRY